MQNVYSVRSLPTFDTKVLEDARSFHELCILYYVATKQYDEFLKHYIRLQYFYRDIANKLSPSKQKDHIEAIYLLYLLTFNK